MKPAICRNKSKSPCYVKKAPTVFEPKHRMVFVDVKLIQLPADDFVFERFAAGWIAKAESHSAPDSCPTLESYQA